MGANVVGTSAKNSWPNSRSGRPSDASTNFSNSVLPYLGMRGGTACALSGLPELSRPLSASPSRPVPDEFGGVRFGGARLDDPADVALAVPESLAPRWQSAPAHWLFDGG